MLRIALIGAGRTVVVGHSPALQALHNLYSVVGIADQSVDALDEVGMLLGVPPAHRFTDYREMLDSESPDAVVITLPHVFHQEAATAALQAGAHVISERPLALSVPDAMDIIRLARKCDKQVIAFHYFLYYPPFREAIRLITDGVIGEPFFVRCEGVTGGYGPGTATYHPEWHANPDIAGGGVWIDSGYHSAYLCVNLLGSPVASVAARITNYATHFPVDDTAVALMTHENGTVSSVQVTWSVPSGGQRILEIYGTRGTITLDHEGYPLGVFDNATQAWRHPPIVTRHAESFIDLYKAIYDALRYGGPLPVSPHDALHTLEIVTAGYRASELQTTEPIVTPEKFPDEEIERPAA